MVKVNLMCGKRNFGTDWLHIDEAKFDHIQSRDIMLHALADNSVDLIYCSHGIAYFTHEELRLLLKAWKRVLKENGILRLATPDWNVLREMEIPLLGPLYGRMPLNADTIYHKTVYSFDTLKWALRNAGFVNIERYDHTQTDHAQFDDHSAAYHDGQLISLNIECNA